MPQDRPATDLDHGLRLDGGFLGDSSAESACENDRFHKTLPPIVEGDRFSRKSIWIAIRVILDWQWKQVQDVSPSPAIASK